MRTELGDLIDGLLPLIFIAMFGVLMGAAILGVLLMSSQREEVRLAHMQECMRTHDVDECERIITVAIGGHR